MASIRKRTDTGRWQVRYRDPSGKQGNRDFDRKLDAQRFATEHEAALMRGEWLDPALGKITFGDWYATWWPRTANLRPSTRAMNESVYRNLVLPTFGGERLSGITQPQVQAWVAGLEASGKAPATVAKAYALFGKVMGAAVDGDMIGKSPCRRITLPEIRPKDLRILTPVEVSLLASTIDPRYRAVVDCAAYLGLRIGELAGLRRHRVDLLRRRVEVAETLVEVRGKITFGAPKTKAGRRTVALPRMVTEVLDQHMRDYSQPGATGLVFPSPEGKPLRVGTWRRRIWARAVEEAGLTPLSPHDLRHTAVSMWIASGATVKEVQSRAGHASSRITLDVYGHLLDDADDRLADRLDAVYVQQAGEHSQVLLALPSR